MSPGTTRRAFFVILVVLSIGLLGAVLWPFAGSIFVASVLAGALFPWQRRLSARLGNRRRMAAGIVTLGVLVAVVLPLAVIGTVVVTEVIDGFQFVRETLERSGVAGLVAALPPALQSFASGIVERIPVDEIGLSQVSQQGGRAAAMLGTLLVATSSLALQTVLMLILLFFLLVDGATLVQWLCDIVPLPTGQFRSLLLEFRKVSHSVLVSSLATAGVQTAAALIGFLIAGVPHPVFFAFVTFFFAFIPAIGAGGLTLALALLLLVSGHPFSAAFLAAWALFVVGLADNVVKPLLIRTELRMHGAVIFFALLGGLAAFGPIGLIAGPMTVTFFLALLRIHRRSVADPQAAPPRSTSDATSLTPPDPTQTSSSPTEASAAAPYDPLVPARCVG